MKIILQEAKLKLMLNKTGSSIILLSMIFISFSLMIIMAISIVRSLEMESKAEMLGRLMTKSVLSEYDKNLLNDYKIMAFQGTYKTKERVDSYIKYAFKFDKKAKYNNLHLNSNGYKMSDIKNFKNSMKYSLKSIGLEKIKSENKKIKYAKQDNEKERIIGNKVVIDTLPSKNTGSSVNIIDVKNGLKDGAYIHKIKNLTIDNGMEIIFLKNYFSNHLYKANKKETYFYNEWEYVIGGKKKDDYNFKICKAKIFLIRNAFNAIAISRDPQKMTMIKELSLAITPGPESIITEGIIIEAWAMAESKYDIDTLLNYGSVELIKTPAEWRTDLSTILSGKILSDKLDKEAVKKLKMEKLKYNIKTGESKINKKGQTYEDYLLFLILSQNEDKRILRIMDIIQINMKFRYYKDFNFSEYFSGINLGFNVNGKNYEFSSQYK